MSKPKKSAPINLADLLAVRNKALKDLGRSVGILGGLSPDDRAAIDGASKTFRDADAAITKELCRLDKPIATKHDGKAVTLWLTHDRLNFLLVDPKTGDPLGMSKDMRRCLGSIKHVYRRTA